MKHVSLTRDVEIRGLAAVCASRAVICAASGNIGPLEYAQKQQSCG